jgi:hypothetical protein
MKHAQATMRRIGLALIAERKGEVLAEEAGSIGRKSHSAATATWEKSGVSGREKDTDMSLEDGVIESDKTVLGRDLLSVLSENPSTLLYRRLCVLT